MTSKEYEISYTGYYENTGSIDIFNIKLKIKNEVVHTELRRYECDGGSTYACEVHLKHTMSADKIELKDIEIVIEPRPNHQHISFDYEAISLNEVKSLPHERNCGERL